MIPTFMASIVFHQLCEAGDRHLSEAEGFALEDAADHITGSHAWEIEDVLQSEELLAVLGKLEKLLDGELSDACRYFVREAI